MKPCTCCGKSAPEVEFGRGQTGRQRSWCRTCEREANGMSMRKARLRERETLAAAEARVETLAAQLTVALLEWRELRERRK